MHETERRLEGLGLRTVCVQARCPNISECFGRGTATFLILGDTCTRSCGFCSVKSGKPQPVDPDEPARIAQAAERLGLRHVVVTSVTRDDLFDGGAEVFARVIGALRGHDRTMTVEVLVPDFLGDESAVRTVVSAGPDIFGHNIETVRALYSIKRHGDYERSLKILSYAKQCSSAIRTKSALLLGMGETEAEVAGVFRDLRKAKCDYLSIGQYLQPGRRNRPVSQYLSSDQFDRYKKTALEMGFSHVESGVYVRSSYLAERYE
jgi:lipoyl synthase